MTLTLDHYQRLNLAVLLGMLECRNVNETRAAWRLMDRLALDDGESRTIELQVQNINGAEIFSWNHARTLPAREYDLTDGELQQIERALSGGRLQPGPMRRWLEPLLAQMPELKETNGHNRQ